MYSRGKSTLILDTNECSYCGHKLTTSKVPALLVSARKFSSGGRPRSRGKRCPCGEMTLKRALAGGHKCGGK